MINNPTNYGKPMTLKVSQLVIDPTYQRDVEKSHVNDIINNFDWRQVDAVKVSYRDGKYFVYDGQHTITAIRAKFGPDANVNCIVQYGLSWEDEAYLFVSQDKNVVRVSGSDKFRANYNRGEENVKEIVSICEKYALPITKNTNKGKIFKAGYVNTLEKYHKVLGKDLFEDGISIVSSAWKDINDVLMRKALVAVFLFIKTYQGEYKRPVAIRKWKQVNVSDIVSAGNASLNRGEVKYAKVLLDIYNKGMDPSDRLIDKF